MTKKEQLLKLHEDAYRSIILKKIEDRTEEENDFVSWYAKKNGDKIKEIKQSLLN